MGTGSVNGVAMRISQEELRVLNGNKKTTLNLNALFSDGLALFNPGGSMGLRPSTSLGSYCMPQFLFEGISLSNYRSVCLKKYFFFIVDSLQWHNR